MLTDANGLRFFLGHHKSGTRYIGLVMEGMCKFNGSCYAELNNPKWFDHDILRALPDGRPLYVKYMNADYRYIGDIPDFRAFHVIRDPRDLAISAYYSHLYSHSTDWWPELAEHRGVIQDLAFQPGLMRDMQFTDQLPTDGFPITVFPAMAAWDYDDPRIIELTFDDLVADPLSFFVTAFSFIGLIDASSDRQRDHLRELIDTYSFEKMSGGRRRGETDPRHHYRSGSPGEWRTRLPRRHQAWFQERYPALLRRFGG
jgi:hypothetical protein